MNRYATVMAVLLAGAAIAPAQKPSDAEVKEGFVSLFNGKDFTGWRFDNNAALPEKLPDNWKVEDGLIKLSGGSKPHLASQWDYDDFEARLEWRAQKKGYNSGFYVRSGRAVNANQINLAEKEAGHLLSGGTGGKGVPELQKPPGEWNEWRVLAVGNKLTFWCNGQMAWEVTDFKPARGYLGLQAEGAAIDFRNVRIKELGYDRLNDLKAWQGDGFKADEDGFVSGDKGGLLETEKKDYKDYVFRVEWRAEKSGIPAGVGLRGSKGEKGFVWVNDLIDGKPTNKLETPAGQWNYLEVQVKGGKGKALLNGSVLSESIDLSKDRGLPEAAGVALQAKGAGVLFRNARLKELKE
jgi:hypothetical protein